MNALSTAAVVILLLFASCAGTSPYRPEYPLTGTSFVSRSGLLRGAVPRGWFTSTEDTIAPALDLWLLREDLGASVTFRELVIDHSAAGIIDRDGMYGLAEVSLVLHSTAAGSSLIAESRCFSESGVEWCAYELLEGGIPKRIVVFRRQGRFFECEAAPLHTPVGKEELRTLFTVQQTVLSVIMSQ